MKKYRIRAYYPNFFEDNQISYVALRLVLFWNDNSTFADVMGISSFPSMKKYKKYSIGKNSSGKASASVLKIYRDAIPSGFIWALVRRVFSFPHILAIAEWRFFHSLQKGDIVYLWPDASYRLYTKLKKEGYFIISERINTLLGCSKRILDAEYDSLGIIPSHGISNENVEVEKACMELSDAIFSPSPGVTGSILSAGIEQKRIIQTSYGLESREVLSCSEKDTQSVSGITFIFVGSICIRKGIHLLLKAWAAAKVGNSRLSLVGRITPEVQGVVTDALTMHPSVTHKDFVEDLVPVYESADCFVLPSLEEGSPLVTYLALGAGLPLIVSEMGAGGIIEDGKEGLVINPHDVEQFVKALEAMVFDNDLRNRLGRAAGEKAPFYTWDKVAGRRKDQLFHILPQA